jgi:DNA-binding LacI/PurR family transcriptional regulator
VTAEPATIYSVATRAGVSISTVSHTLNRPQRVNPDTRRRVLEAIDELGYVPKASAVAHARKAVGRIGVIAPFSSYESYMRRLTGMLQEAEGTSTELVIYDHESAASAVSPLLSTLPITQRVDGLVIMGVPLDDRLADRLFAQSLPTVLVDTHRRELDSVTIDDHAAGELVARHLLDRGRRSFAYVSEPQLSDAFLSQGQMRRNGFRRTLSNAGIPPDEVRHVCTGKDIPGGRQAIAEMVANQQLPQAIFAHHDVIAVGIMLECKERGIRVPDDLAVVGFDDGLAAEALQLTTVRQPFEESGRLGFRRLQDLVSGRIGSAQHLSLSVELIPRATT